MMIDVLIVDDDKLVRKGLISAMPWQAFGMRVVGEAANGEKALEFLAANRVELLLTDLAMPVMSGIELIRIVRKRYPDVAVAVLTLHQDFEYIQEALRLGAVDYIAKVQLEQERFEEVLGRIHARILEARRKPSEEKESPAALEVYPANIAYALLALRESAVAGAGAETNSDRSASTITEAASDDSANWRSDSEADKLVRIWWPDSDRLTSESEREPRLPPLPRDYRAAEWRLLRLRQAAGASITDLMRTLLRYRSREFFYDCDGSEPHPIDKSLAELRDEQAAPDEAETAEAREALHSFRWIHNDSSYAALRARLRELKLPVPKLTQLLYGCIVDWNRLYRGVAQAPVSLPEAFACWSEVDEWLSGIRETATAVSGRLQLSPEVSGSIMEAVKIVHDELDRPVFAVDVARRVNLSRSYFNQCFKELVGHSFNEYLRKVRIDKAREYLVQTAKPIQWVAEHTGYADEKYFSRIFREQTGMLPSDYRQKQRQG